jgi:Sulfotransferase family
MLIFNSKKMIYIHIHKTGGETVEHLLAKFRAWNDIILDADHPGMTQEYEQHFNLNKHSTALDVVNILGKEVWDSFYSWATVRNPYERIASLYGYVASISEPDLSLTRFPMQASPNVQRNWVESAEYPMRDQWAFAGVRAYLATRGSESAFSDFLRHPLLRTQEPAYCSQYSRLSNASGDALLVTRVVKVETLSSLWPQLCNEMRVPYTELLIKNATPNKWKRTVADLFTKSADLELINTLYADDFRQFKYDIVGPDHVARVVAPPSAIVER